MAEFLFIIYRISYTILIPGREPLPVPQLSKLTAESPGYGPRTKDMPPQYVPHTRIPTLVFPTSTEALGLDTISPRLLPWH